ncbi:MAG: hydroxymethylglutaryl-CoA lyase, partial [Pseudomonadota bacterium]
MTREKVEVVEVSARDGIQNERTILSTEDKVSLLRRARDAGLARQEVTSFVNPKRVPQMADADAVAAAVPAGITSIGLTLNRRGHARAVASGMDEANAVVVASDTFNRRNQGVGTEETLAAIAEILAGDAPIRTGVAVAAAFGCPFEGEVSVARLMSVVEAVMAAEPAELSLADTIGVATPRDITERVGAVRAAFPDVPLRLHLHNTRGTGLANAWAGIEAGIDALDSSLGGVGGCPFAPNATG